jgi:putative CocE/NonD family hydrolase
MRKIPGPYNVSESHTTLPAYDRKPEYDKMKWDRDVMVRMRDGVHVCVDVYRPDASGKFPALLAFCAWNKDLQTPDATENNGPQPAWSPFWFGGQEAGDSRFLTSRGYAHIIGNPRGIGKSEDSPAGTPPMAPNMDFYDLIEWIAAQPWCDGNVGMLGRSAFAGAQ